jgi:hypothetical protein
MAIPFTQLVASTFDAVSNERNKAADNWSDSSFLKFLEKAGGIKRVDGGVTFQPTLDYQQNPGLDFMLTDMTPTSVTKTQVLTAASYTPVPVVVPVTWSLYDEALNSGPNQKVDLAAALVDNAINSHDYGFEAAMFAATGGTDGFNTFTDIFTEDGTGTVGTIVAGTETWWKNQFKDWGTDTGATLLADYVTLWNSCSRGSGGRSPNLLVGNGYMQANYEAALTPNQRFNDTSAADGGFKALKFKNADYIFTSAYAPSSGDESCFMFNTNDTYLQVVRGAWRQRRSPVEHANAAAYTMKIFSVAQLVTRNRFRGGRLFT